MHHSTRSAHPLRRAYHLVALALTLVCAAVLGCETPRAATRTPTEFFVFLDRSVSINDRSMRHFLEQDIEELLRTLAPGDRVVLHGVDELTADAAPLLDVELPASAGESMNEEMRYQGQKKKLFEDVRAKARGFLEHRDAKQTDIFGAFNRLGQAGTRRRVVMFLSDAVHSTRDFDMERIPITPGTAVGSMKAAARERRWKEDLLRGVEVRFHLALPDEPSDSTAAKPGATVQKKATAAPKKPRGPVNDRDTLKTYWTALIGSLGGSVTHFENAKFRAPEGAIEPSTATAEGSTTVAGAVSEFRKFF
jgi:hypothetical protein